jgi:hypothetical protein
MSEAANASEFEGAAYTRNYDAAQGIQPGYYDKRRKPYDDKDYVLGGIFQPEMEKLRPGLTIFRFSNFGRDTPQGARGPWWLSRETMESLVARATSEHHLASLARQHLAVPDDWNMMTGIFTATVARPLRAFGGVGGMVRQDPPDGSGTARKGAFLPGGTELTGRPADRTMKRQLFIPGLPKVPDAIDVTKLQTISNWFAAFNRGDI